MFPLIESQTKALYSGSLLSAANLKITILRRQKEIDMNNSSSDRYLIGFIHSEILHIHETERLSYDRMRWSHNILHLTTQRLKAEMTKTWLLLFMPILPNLAMVSRAKCQQIIRKFRYMLLT